MLSSSPLDLPVGGYVDGDDGHATGSVVAVAVQPDGLVTAW